MFDYNYNPKTRILNITLPKNMAYGFEFMDDISEMIKIIHDDEKGPYYQIRISCKKEPQYDKMCKVYLYNVLRSLSTCHTILWSYELNGVITSSVNTRSGSKFEEINLQQAVVAGKLNDYRFLNDKSVNKPVEEVAKIIVEKNFTIGENEVKEFLTTTVGEIFSNAFLHSEKEETFFFYDIESKNGNFYLCVTVIDYGNTIVHNVKEFFQQEQMGAITSEECIRWAIARMHTTRKGSGGYGLPTLIDYIKGVLGELIILSGDAYYKLHKKKESTGNTTGYFLGTSVMFRIKLFETSNIIGYDKNKEKLISINLENL